MWNVHGLNETCVHRELITLPAHLLDIVHSQTLTLYQRSVECSSHHFNNVVYYLDPHAQFHCSSYD